MKKILLTICMLLMLIPSVCLAEGPTITSDSRTFDPIRGIYDLRGNVFVQFPAQDTMLTITGDTTQVYLYAAEVHGKDNITLTYGNMNFRCDKVDVYGTESTAYVSGNISFVQGGTSITADSGSFNWRTKLASFSGNVKVNGKPQKDGVTYNVIKSEIVPQAPPAEKKK